MPQPRSPRDCGVFLVHTETYDRMPMPPLRFRPQAINRTIQDWEAPLPVPGLPQNLDFHRTCATPPLGCPAAPGSPWMHCPQSPPLA